MDTPQVTLDQATATALRAAGRPVPLCDPAGEVIGYYVTPDQLSRIEAERVALRGELDRLYPPEKIRELQERRKNDPRPNVPHDEVLRWVEER